LTFVSSRNKSQVSEKKLKDINMEQEETKKVENGVHYSNYRFQILKLEFQGLLVEYKGLVNAAKGLAQFNNDTVRPLVNNDIRFETVYWRCREISSRYNGQVKTIRDELKHKTEQILGALDSIECCLEEAPAVLVPGVNLDLSLSNWKKVLSIMESEASNDDILNLEILNDQGLWS
jgi:hypothetical protein